MFFTLGIIIGFVLGWFVNDKWDWIKSKAVFWKSKTTHRKSKERFYRNTRR